MAPPEVSAASRAPRRPRTRRLTRSRCRCAPERPRRVAMPSPSMASTCVELGARQRRVGRRAAHQREERVLVAPTVAGARAGGDQLLRQDVERRRRASTCRSICPRTHRAHRRRALDQLVARHARRCAPWACRRRRGRRDRCAGAGPRSSAASRAGTPARRRRCRCRARATRSPPPRAAAPFCSLRSTARRVRLASAPWCAATTPSPSRSSRSCATRSARRRLGTKISVVLCSSMSAAEPLVDVAPTLRARPPRASGSLGTSIAEIERLLASGVDDAAGPRAAARRCRRGSAPTSAGRLAPSPTGRCACSRRVLHSASSRSSESARCAPRLLPTSAWISSTITVSTPPRIAAPAVRR